MPAGVDDIARPNRRGHDRRITGATAKCKRDEREANEICMATFIEPQRQSPDERFVLHGVDWNVYEAIATALGDRSTRLTFDGENLEFMRPSRIHEWYGNLVGRMLEAIGFEFGIPICGGGSTTFRRRDVARGLEPDECYWIQNEPAVRGKRELDLRVDPPPDLAIEIDVSRSSLDRLAIYAKSRIPEIWRFDGESVHIHMLQDDGSYAEDDASRCLPPLPVHEIAQFLQPDGSVDDTTRVRRFVEHVRPFFGRDLAD